MIALRGKLQPTASLLAVAEPLALLLVAPLLLFPAVWPPLTAAGLALLAILALARWIVRGELWPASPFNTALLLFVLTIPAAVWASAIPDLTWPKLAGIILGLLTFRVLALSIRNRRTLAWGIAAFIAVGVAILALGALSTDWSSKVPLLRPLVQRLPQMPTELPGTLSQGVNANQLAGAALLYLPLAVALAKGWWRTRRWRLALTALAGACAVGGTLLLTQSRSGWIGAAAGLLALVVLSGLVSRRGRVRAAAILLPTVLILVLTGALTCVGTERIEEVWSQSDSSISTATVVGRLSLSGRVEIWSRALCAIQDFPFTGVGLGTFRQVVHLLYPLVTISPVVDIAHAHNMFLQVALDLGLPGLIAYLALLWVVATVAWQAAKQGSLMVQALAIGLLSGLIGLHAYGLTDALALGSKPSVAFWMILGLLAALPRVTEPQEEAQRIAPFPGLL